MTPMIYVFFGIQSYYNRSHLNSFMGSCDLQFCYGNKTSNELCDCSMFYLLHNFTTSFGTSIYIPTGCLRKNIINTECEVRTYIHGVERPCITAKVFFSDGGFTLHSVTSYPAPYINLTQPFVESRKASSTRLPRWPDTDSHPFGYQPRATLQRSR